MLIGDQDYPIDEYLIRFMKMTEGDILDLFLEISEDAELFCPDGDYQSLFIPGRREDRALLVAHVDTVWNDTPLIDVGKIGNLLVSGHRFRGLDNNNIPENYGLGIGADDRAGVALLYKFALEGQHSILLPCGEESGCLGSSCFMSEQDHIELINNHQFAIEFDRKGYDDLVFYNLGTKEFIKYCKEQTGFKTQPGSFSDICVLCEKICGVNISVGYKNEHTCNEFLNIRWWLNTLVTLGRWLNKDLPKFERH